MKKEECLPNAKGKVNHKVSKINTDMGTKYNGLVAFDYKTDGVLLGQEIEILPNTDIEILSKPTRFNGNGNQVKFKIDESERIFSAWWICFKQKVDLVVSK
jgi:hypothetical protein